MFRGTFHVLPFLKNKRIAGASIQYRAPDEKPEGSSEDHQALESAALDLIHAIESKDIKAVASALKAAWEICESYEPSPSDASSEPMETE